MGKVFGRLALATLAICAVGADWHLSRECRETADKQAPAEVAVYANILGQFRSIAASFLWMKADTYHHEHIERNQNWAENTEIMPLLKMVTVLDPHFTQAYASAAWMLALYHNRPGPARAFLAEGIRNNPKSADLYQTMAVIAWRCDGNAESTIRYLRKAADCTGDAFEKRAILNTVRSLQYQLDHGLENPTLGTLAPSKRNSKDRPAANSLPHPGSHSH